MKITRELKDIIARKLQEQEHEKRRKTDDERKAAVATLNEHLIASEEFKSLMAAAEKWERLVNDVTEANAEIASRNTADCRYGGTFCAWNLRNMLSAKTVEPLNFLPDNNLRMEFLDKQDSIIMRLSYGKDFEEAKAILAEYGITI